MNYIWSCSCGLATPCSKEEQDAGAVWLCASCGTGSGCVRTLQGRKVWVTLDKSEIEFYDIFKIEDDEDE